MASPGSATQIQETGKTSPDVSATHMSNVPGVRYVKRKDAWAATWAHEEQGSTSSSPRTVNKLFSIRRLGYDEAKRQAEAARLEADTAQRRSGPHVDGGVPPKQHESRCADQPQAEGNYRKRARTADRLGELQSTKRNNEQPRSTVASDLDHPQSTVNGVHWRSIHGAWVATWSDVDTGKHCSPTLSLQQPTAHWLNAIKVVPACRWSNACVADAASGLCLCPSG
jgi:hypothetical protein